MAAKKNNNNNKNTVVSSKEKRSVMNPILCRMKKRSPSTGQNNQLVHWWLLIHSSQFSLQSSTQLIPLNLILVIIL
jgi:hypothetical protein